MRRDERNILLGLAGLIALNCVLAWAFLDMLGFI
jgi:hypothetical protein